MRSAASQWIEPPGRAVLALGGPEARGFLQGLVSNDIERVNAAQTVWSALLSPQGRYLFDFFVIAQPDGVLLETGAERLGELVQRLTMYRLRSRVTIEPTELRVALVFGPDAASALGLPEERGATRREGEIQLFVDPREPALGVRLVGPNAALEQLRARLGAAPGDPARYDALRIGLGVPDGGRDLVPQKSLLLENGFAELDGVSFAKGCFVGQELTARMRFRGLVKKRLVPVRIEGDPPPLGTAVMTGEKEAGELRSCAGELCLALLRLDALQAGQPLRAGAAVLRPELPAWLVPAVDGKDLGKGA